CLNNKTFITLDYRSEDEGITWNYTSHPENGNNWDSQLHFVNENLGFSVLNCSDGGGYDTWGSLLMTTDGGKNWNYVYKNLFEKELYSIRFEKSGVGWACGKNGTVLKYEPDISSIINAPVQKTIPVTLLQNYPNPFNPTTTIKYSVAGQGKVSIFIYDLLGRVISKLLDEEKPAGEYKITWNASACPSGIYFIRMQTGQFSQSRKIILMK
ncbi:MAG: T9SS type A sorting domain-containing protein, partial [Methanococcaceae archaeon]